MCPKSMCLGLMRTWSFVLDKCAYLWSWEWSCLFFKLRTIPFQSASLIVPIAKVDAIYQSWHLAPWPILEWGKDSDFAKELSCQHTFSSWQLQWWSQLWVEYPPRILKGRCTCTFITFKDGNDSLAIGKYLADSWCRNMFRLSKCSKPVPPDRHFTYIQNTLFFHAQWEQAQLCRLHSLAVYDFFLCPFTHLPSYYQICQICQKMEWWRRLTAAGTIFGSTTFPR